MHYLVFAKNRKEYLTKFSFDVAGQLGWSTDKEKAVIFPDKGSAEMALDMTIGSEWGFVEKANTPTRKGA